MSFGEILAENALPDRLKASGATQLTFAAAAVHALGEMDELDWATVLYGEGTDGRQVFNIVTELLDGRYTRLLDLAEAVGTTERERKRSVKWPEVAAMLEQAAGKDEDKASWRNAAVALRMLALWRTGMGMEQRFEQLDIFSQAPETAKTGIADAIASAEGKYAQRAKRQYYGILQRAIEANRLQDPVLASLFARIAPYPRAAAFGAQLLGSRAPAGPLYRALVRVTLGSAATLGGKAIPFG